MVLEQIVALMVDLVLDLISTPPLFTRLEVMAPSWAIFGAPTHLIFFFCFGEIYGLGLDLGDIDFSFCLCCCCCCFLNNFVAYWGLTLLFIVVSSCLFYLFNKISFSSSSLNLNIRTTLLVVLVSGCLSFVGKICAGFRGLLFLINLSLIVFFFLMSSYGYSV